jgi:hypothetical protein
MSILKIFRRQSVQTNISNPSKNYNFWNKKIEYEEKHTIALGNSSLGTQGGFARLSRNY